MGPDEPVRRVRCRLVALGNLTDAIKALERASTNDCRALHYLELAEKSKHLKTHHVRASMYELGVGLPQDCLKALECLELGVRRGSDVCRMNLAIMLLSGHGGEGRRAEGFSLLQRLLAEGVESPGYCLSKLGYIVGGREIVI